MQRNANVSARYADLKGSKISTLTTIHSIQVSKFHKSLKSSTGVKLFQLQVCISSWMKRIEEIYILEIYVALSLIIKLERNCSFACLQKSSA